MADRSLSKLRHDLRTGVGQILGYTELLEEEAEARELADFTDDLGKIRTAADRLLLLFDGLFDGTEAVASAQTAAAGATASSEDNGAAEAEAGGRLLVVDDNEMNRDMLSRRLARQGYDVATAEDGEAALRAIEAEPFDLILLDVMMPGISGLEVLERLRKRYTLAALPVVMVTAMIESADMVRAFELGANDYVTKPLDMKVVLARTRTQLELKRITEQNERLKQQLELRSAFIRRTFGRYLSDDIVDEVLESPTGLELGGEKRSVSILMSDIRGFSAMCERLPPADVLRVLNNYLGTMIDVIIECGGTIEEFIGDAIVVYFGAPVAREDHADVAVRCALAMEASMGRVNAVSAERGLPAIEQGIGVNTGELVVGNIGSERRSKYGGVGATINLASRVQSYTLGGQVMISEATRAALSYEVEIAATMQVHPKGSKVPLDVHDVVGVGGDAPIRLVREGDDLRSPPSPLVFAYSVIEGKDTGGAMIDAPVRGLSTRGAELAVTGGPEPLTDVRMCLRRSDGADVADDVYAKVVTTEADAVTVRFTSLSPAAKAFLAETLG